MKYISIMLALAAIIVSAQAASTTNSSEILNYPNEQLEVIRKNIPIPVIANSSTCELSKCLSNCDKNYDDGSKGHKNCQLNCTAKCE